MQKIFFVKFSQKFIDSQFSISGHFLGIVFRKVQIVKKNSFKDWKFEYSNVTVTDISFSTQEVKMSFQIDNK